MERINIHFPQPLFLTIRAIVLIYPELLAIGHISCREGATDILWSLPALPTETGSCF